MKKMPGFVVALLAVTTITPTAFATSIDWGGTYRFEYVDLEKTSLGSPSLGKAYGLNYLSLTPKIVVSDGLNIIGKFNVLSNAQYPNSQMGAEFGVGSNPNFGLPTNSGANSNATNGSAQNTYIQASQLYMTLNEEYGQFIIGRAPIQFGLGMTYNAGNGIFDHWSDTRDMLGYKVVVSEWSIMPAIAKVAQNGLGFGQEIQDLILNVEFNNPETESALGVWYQTRTSGSASNDAPAYFIGGPGASVTGGWNTQDLNIFFSRGFEGMKFRLEAGFRNGTTGITDSAGDAVNVDGYGVALEMDFPSREVANYWQIRAGLASGKNPTSQNFGSFYFNRNYDVAFMLFNHPLGSYDLFQTSAQRNMRPNCIPSPTSSCLYSTGTAADEETVSNAYYFSPRYKHAINDHWDWTATFTYALLQTNPLVATTSIAKDVGFELDWAFNYRPTPKILWSTELGLLDPGGAFKGGTNDYPNGFTYGMQTRAAYSF